MKKKNNSLLIGIVIIAILMIVVGIVFNFYLPKKEKDKPKKEETVSEKEKIKDKQYTCSKGFGNDIVKLENIYEFTYGEDIKDYSKKFVVTYSNIQEYNEAVYDSFFNKEDEPDEILKDDAKQQKTYIWYEALNYDKEENVESYLKVIESYGYKCTQN